MTIISTLADVLPPESLAPTDTLDTTATGSVPEAVAVPAGPDEVVEVLKWAAAAGKGVLPVGNGSGLGPVQIDRPWIALSTRRLSGVDVYEAADLTITVGAGTGLAEVDAVLRAERQWAPFDPPGTATATVGGLVAFGHSGPLWAGYGEVRNHVLGVTLVTGDGRLLRLGGRVVKNVAGYDLLKPLVGSLGSLGVMTSVCLRTFPQPAVDRIHVVESDSDLATLASRVATADVVPASAVVIDRAGALDGPALLIRLHGSEPTVDADRACFERHLGATLEAIEPDLWTDGGLESEVRDRVTGASVQLRVSARPSRFGAALGMLDDLEHHGFAGDVISGSFDVGLDAERVDGMAAFVRSIESTGGAVRTVVAPPGHPAWALSTREAQEVLELTEAVRVTFDPADTLWPGRRR